MEHFIDSLSKKLAATASRRVMLSTTSRALFASFVNSSGLGRLWDLGSSSVASGVCPGCGTCELCNLDTGACGAQCPNPCVTHDLCEDAHENRHYLKLESYLNSRGFTVVRGPESVGNANDHKHRGFVLVTFYATLDPTHTAALFFRKHGSVPFAIEFENETPTFGYIITKDEEIETFTGPISAEALVRGTRKASRDDGNGTSTRPLASALDAGSLASAITISAPPLRTCDFGSAVCNRSCGFIGKYLCAEGAELGCAIFIEQPELIPICVFALSKACSFASSSLCKTQCEDFFCGCMGECGGPCQVCSDDQCIPIQCEPGFTCSGGIGCTSRCPSDSTPCTGGLVGVQCCSASQICVNGNCTSCPPGSSLCGLTCCALVNEVCVNGTCACASGFTACGSACCSSAQICSNGTCVACPSGETVCGTTCCPAGSTCQNGSCTTSGCPIPILCGSRCCPPESFACINKDGSCQTCCPSDGICCPDPTNPTGLSSCVFPAPPRTC
jgi:hypothetical protein